MTIKDSITYTQTMGRLPPESTVTPVDHSLETRFANFGPTEIHLLNLIATLSGRLLLLSDLDIKALLLSSFLGTHLPIPDILECNSNVTLQNIPGVHSVQKLAESPVLTDGHTPNPNRSHFEFAYQIRPPNGRIIWKRDIS